MISRVFSCFLLLFLAFVPGFAQSHTPTPAQPKTAAVAAATVLAIPKNPKDLMLLADRVNGLSAKDMNPWHLKANYQTFDADGKPKDTGVFEEWWAGPEKWKVSYASQHFNQTLYRNGKTRLETGDEGWVSSPELMVREYLDSPMPSESTIQNRKFSVIDTKIGAVSLTCLRPLPARNAVELPTICLNQGSAALRLQSFYGGLYVQFNNIVLADGHYVAKQISVENSSQMIARANVTQLDFPARLTDADFAAPASARVAPHLPDDSGLSGGHRTQEIYSIRPGTTWSDKGMVILEVTITKSGDVRDIDVVSGPREFRDNAVRNVRTWKFTPYLLNGKPVEVRARIDMLYGKWPAHKLLIY